MARVYGTCAPLVSVVWGCERVQASNALPRCWLADITASAPSERHPHPTVTLRPVKDAAALMKEVCNRSQSGIGQKQSVTYGISSHSAWK